MRDGAAAVTRCLLAFLGQTWPSNCSLLFLARGFLKFELIANLKKKENPGACSGTVQAVDRSGEVTLCGTRRARALHGRRHGGRPVLASPRAHRPADPPGSIQASTPSVVLEAPGLPPPAWNLSARTVSFANSWAEKVSHGRSGTRKPLPGECSASHLLLSCSCEQGSETRVRAQQGEGNSEARGVWEAAGGGLAIHGRPDVEILQILCEL